MMASDPHQKIFLVTKTVHDELQRCLRNLASRPSSILVKNRTWQHTILAASKLTIPWLDWLVTCRPSRTQQKVFKGLNILFNDAQVEAVCTQFHSATPSTRTLCTPRKAFTQQQLLMELLAAEHSGKELDDGELEGSGDEY
jgi:hypothetical protein